ncbi:RidA family protein [Falsiroseomonas sp.]|uniref:RidA family protein n=1 Tax=Falsiroseomonas sp. TaxID=2870721 RepID=UPI002732944F|nr:RidA family protein [Falsiroseomonas sp.]MDP3418792.1 RidA family protein [Falsiroseomonas sp.]
MARSRISSGSRFEEEIGYSRAVVDGDWIFVSGTTGYDYATMTIAPGVVDQCEQTFRNIDTALRQANGRMEDVVRAVFLVPDRADWPLCWPVVKKWLGRARPASTMMVVGLQTPEMRIEIEVTARLRRRDGDK